MHDKLKLIIIIISLLSVLAWVGQCGKWRRLHQADLAWFPWLGALPNTNRLTECAGCFYVALHVQFYVVLHGRF